MLPGILFSVFLVRHAFFQRDNRLARISLILAGAVIGVVVVLWQTYSISGQFFQGSAQTKLHWSSVIGHDILAPMRLISSIVFPYFDSLNSALKYAFVVISAALTALAFVLRLRALRAEGPSDAWLCLFVFAGCVLTIAGYVLFYRFNSVSLQTWYSSNILVPLAVSIAAILLFIVGRKTFTTAILALTLYVSIGMPSIFSITWPWQAGMMHAGLYLRSQEAQPTYAAWNAGIISYFSGKPVVNIDGLTNDDVLPFIKSNRLLDYLKLRKIDYLIDYEEMIRYRDLRLRGGYEEFRTDRCLRPLHAVDGDIPKYWGESRLRLIEIIPECL